MVMLIEVIKLTLFPAMMAFAASSDLFTMTIANRVSLILVAGFALLAAADRDERGRPAVACWRRRRRAGRRLRLLYVRLDRRRRRQARGRDGAVVRLRPPCRLFVLRFVARRRADAADHLFPRRAAAAGLRRAAMGRAAAPVATAAFLTGSRSPRRRSSSTRTPSGWRRSVASRPSRLCGPDRPAGRRQSKAHGVTRN